VLSTTLMFLLSTAWGEAIPGDQEIVGALKVDITPAGFAAIGEMVPGLAPEAIPVEGISEGYEGAFGECWLGGATVDIGNLNIGLEIEDIVITPQTGYLDVDIKLLVHVNGAADPFYMDTMLECIENSCDVWVDPFPVTAQTTMALELIEEPDPDDPTLTISRLDATLGELGFDFELTGDDVSVENCTIGTILDVLGFIGIDLVDLLIGPLSGALDGTIDDLGPELEATLEDAFSAASIDQSIDLQGATLNITARPGDMTIRPEGMRISMDGSAYADQTSPCVADWDDGTFDAMLGPAPEIGDGPDGVPADFGAALLVSDDFGHQAMYALWRSGLLCYTVDEDLGFPIDTSLLGLLAGDAFNELFPDARPMVIVTRPKQPPTMNFASDHDIGLKVNELGLDFMGELDHRMARVLAMDLEVDAGVDLNFDGSTGNLGIAIDLGEDSITPTVSSNDFAPDSSDTIEASFGSVFNGLVGGLLGDALGDLSFSVPGFEGIGLTELQFSSAGAEQDWLGGYAWLGEVEYASTGCSEDGSGGCGEEGGGCGDVEGAGCEGGGCTTAPRNQRRWLWLLFPTFLIALRRRE
jgi:hypothetical protein